jgi:hypothetical protein
MNEVMSERRPWSRLDLPNGSAVPLEGPCSNCDPLTARFCEMCNGTHRVPTENGLRVLEFVKAHAHR